MSLARSLIEADHGQIWAARRAAVMRTLQVRTLADLVRLGERLGELLTSR